jgi:predicted nucleic acid-binding protein
MPCGLDGIVAVIIDTTVWIDFFRNAKTKETELLELVVRRGDAAFGDLIVSEILQGVDTDREFRSLRRHIANFHVYAMDDDHSGSKSPLVSAINADMVRRATSPIQISKFLLLGFRRLMAIFFPSGDRFSIQ